MKKITKIGLSALCGSLASASAYAGALSVSGGATATWLSKEGTENGNPIGLSSGLTFSGSGEFDNGTTFTLTLTHADQDAYSAGSIVINTPSFGQFRIGGADGVSGIDSHDDKMPTAWEETDGTGLTIGHDKISGVGGSMNLGYKTPSFLGTTLQVAYAPRNNGAQNNDKASSGSASEHKQNGYDALIDINTGGLVDIGSANIFAGYSMTERAADNKAVGTNVDANSDHEEAVGGVIFTVGPVSLGGQASAEWLGNEQTGSDVAGYRNIGYGISFNVNDDLSVSYGENTSKKGFVSKQNNPTIESKAASWQVAYTMGGAALKVAKTSVDSQNYTSGTGSDREGMTFALSLAF